jgi:hypothetical protein
MRPMLVSSNWGNYTGGGTADVYWYHDLAAIGRNRLLIVAGAAREEGGEQNPEEPNVGVVSGATQYGNWFFPGEAGNSQEFGSQAYFWRNHELPAPGNTYMGVNFKDSPKYAEKHRGCSAYFMNVKQQAQESYGRDVGNGGSRSVTVSVLSENSLVVAMYAWRVGFAETWGGSVTPIVTNRGDNALGISLAYAIANKGSFTVTATAGNPEDNALLVAVFAPSPDTSTGGII